MANYSARHLNGTTDRLVSGNLTSTAPTAYTWALWVKGDNAPGTATLSEPFEFANDTGFVWDNTYAPSTQCAQQHTASLTYATARIPSALLANVWYHVAATWDGSALTVYLNGTLSATGNVSSIAWGTYPVYVGGNPGALWPGSVSEAALWLGTAQPASVIAALASCTKASNYPTNLTGYWPITGASPEPDQSGNGNNLTVTGTTIVLPYCGVYSVSTSLAAHPGVGESTHESMTNTILL